MPEINKKDEKNFKVIEISELDKGYLVVVCTTHQTRNVIQKEMYAYSETEEIEMMELVFRELGITIKK